MKPMTMQITVTFEEDILTDLVRQAVTSAVGIAPEREAFVRAPQHSNFGGQKPPEIRGQLIPRATTKLLRESPSTAPPDNVGSHR